MKKNTFIWINSIHHVLEYLIIYIIIQTFTDQLWLRLFYMGCIFIFSLIFVMSQINVTKVLKKHAKTINERYLDDIQSLTKTFSEIGISDFLSIHVDALPSPMMYADGKIYFNEAYTINQRYKKALMAHELGHYVSDRKYHNAMSVIGYASIRPSFYLARAYKGFRAKLIYKRIIKPRSLLDYWFSIPYYILFLMNYLTVYRAMQKDELIANRVAIELGYGHELRTYYYEILRRKTKKDFLDFEHPSIRYMVNVMNEEMGIDDAILKDVYLREGRIVYVDDYYSPVNKRDKKLRYWETHPPQDGVGWTKYAQTLYHRGVCSNDELLKCYQLIDHAIDMGDGNAVDLLASMMKKQGRYDALESVYMRGVSIKHIRSARQLAAMYKNGLYVERNLEKSYAFYSLAGEFGDSDSQLISDYYHQWFEVESQGVKISMKLGLDGFANLFLVSENEDKSRLFRFRRQKQKGWLLDEQRKMKYQFYLVEGTIQFEEQDFLPNQKLVFIATNHK